MRNAQVKEMIRAAYKYGYQDGVEDGPAFCRQACEEGWQQYLEMVEESENTGLAPVRELPQ